MEFQPKLGEVVGIPLSYNGTVLEGSHTITEGVVVALDADDEGLDVCVGFKLNTLLPGSIIPADATRYGAFHPTTWVNSEVSLDIKDYDVMCWVYHDQIEHRFQPKQVSVSTHPQGVSCSKCGEGNPYGEANQPDGSYKCGGCRR